ncbi:adenosine deaminase family protein [Kushneria phyllosphaerae]|uniref:adenosine deaminase n=1 Tax=Kushneria phyllosphaerae TaxID=2100822 RepID=A0A2R8CJG3_9GAMM|nr:adenosine deaminase [Kushneria phyllosphaerae]SPJ33047.1 Aminodeoxyfutalosine deaminase [Kushneria phyllosphaerae]
MLTPSFSCHRRLAALLTLSIGAVLMAAPVNAEDHRTAQTADLMAAIRDQPPRLRMFLQRMPKGGDIHHHLWGAPWPETLLEAAGRAGICVRSDGSAIVPPPCKGETQARADGLARRDSALYAELLNALSMRNTPAGPGVPPVQGHDHFFATFDGFAPIAAASPGALLSASKQLAAQDHLGYLESISNPGAVHGFGAMAQSSGLDDDDLDAAWQALSPEIDASLADARRETDEMFATAQSRLGCDGKNAAPGCDVTVRLQGFAVRTQPPMAVFGQLMMAFALADADPRYVGVNIVAPEDNPVALADYDRHMKMLAFLSKRYPEVPLSLHAGELTLGLVPPFELRDHIQKAVEVAGARRIGHGVDIAHEQKAPQLLQAMVDKEVAVEINLTSNDVILGVRGAEHPLNLYRDAGVPLVLATDDQGVSRIDLTREYERAVTEHGLDYPALKQMARNSLEYSFLAGESLWEKGKTGETRVAACRDATLDAAPEGDCGRLIEQSDRARLQWQLEQHLAAFEDDVAQWPQWFGAASR